jgi:ATP/maltotriose-dependent transcriptional regulator MalT
MFRLPTHHVPRPRLTDACREAPVVVVEASAGYGKSVLGAELVGDWGAVPVTARLEDGAESAELLVGRLRAAVARAGFVDAAEAMRASGEDYTGAIDAMLAALARETCAIVVDDAHHAARAAGLLIDRIAGGLVPPQRLVVLARVAPPGTERLRRAGSLWLGAADLGLRADETLELCRSGFGLDVSADDGRLLDAATGGWTAAAVLAASRAKQTARPLRDLAGLGGELGSLSESVALILDELLVALGPERRLLGQIAPLPLVDRELLGAVTGDPGFFDRAIALGLPLTSAGNGWWELPGPVRDHLATLAAPDPSSLLTAAGHYKRRGQLGTALHMLLGAGEAESTARLLAGANAHEIETVDPLELLALVGRIPRDILGRHPWATFQVARACGVAALLEPRSRLLKQVDSAVRESHDAALRRAIDVELAIDVLNGGSPAEAEALGHRVLESLTAGEELTRARALTVVGFALCWRRAEGGVLPEASLRAAGRHLEDAANLYVALGYREWTTGAVAPRAIWAELGIGHASAALEVIDEGLSDCAGRPRRVGRLLYHRAEVLTELGRFDEAETNLEDAEAIGRRYDDSLVLAYSHWGRMTLASLRGDSERTLYHADQAQADRGEWWPVLRAELLADSADCLDRVGHVALAAERLALAREDPERAEAWIAMSECALLARHGDPEAAEDRLRVVHRRGIFPREYWRVTLMRAYAASRRGESSAGALAAQAFEEAGLLGQPQLPLIRERELTQALLGLALELGSPAARELETTSSPRALSLLGRFELTEGGRAVVLPAGQPAQLVKLVAVNGGRLLAEQAIEVLWPETSPATGRNRLRTVLGRLREAAPDVVARDGELLVLAPEVRVDLAEFHREAREAQALIGDPRAAVALATGAIARYRGDLLPHDLYEDWADEPRESARRTMVELLDLCARTAAKRGDLDEARRMVERTIELAPYDDDRYLRVASILREQGRHGAAISVLRRARSTLAELGVPLPEPLHDLDESPAELP